MTSATVRLLNANNTLFVECGPRSFYLDLDDPARAMNELTRALKSWTARGVIEPQEARLSAEELEALIADYREKHKDDISLEELKGLGL